MSVLRSTTFQLEVKNEDGTTKMKQFTRAVSDSKAVTEELNQKLGENVTVTTKTVKSADDYTRQARLLTAQIEKTNAAYNSQVSALQQQIAMVGKSEVEQATMINQMRLGTTATNAQIAEVARLTQEYYALQAAQGKAGGSMRNLRGIAQNFGWQLQDTVVQLQMGTDWMIVMSQQGSQMAAAFGAWGAIIGAGIALLGAALPSLVAHFRDASDEVNTLDELQKSLNSTFDQTSYTVAGLSTGMRELYKVNKQLAELKMVVALNEAESAMKSYQKQVEDTIGSNLTQIKQMQAALSSGQATLDNLLPQNKQAYQTYLTNTQNQLDSILDKLGLNTDQIKEMQAAYNQFTTTGDTSGLTKVFNDISAASNNKLSPALRELISNFTDNASKMELNRAQLERIRELVDGTADPTQVLGERTETLAQQYERMTRQLTMTDAQKTIDNFLTKEATALKPEEVAATKQAITAYYSEKEAVDAKAKALKEATAAEKQAATQRDRTLAQLEKTINRGLVKVADDPVSAENTKHLQTMNQLNQLRAGYRENDYANQQKINKLMEDENTRHAQAMKDAQLDLVTNQVNTIASTVDFMADIANELATGADDVKSATDDMNDFQKTMFFMQRAMLAAQALINGISLGMQLAALYPVAAPAMITLGTSLGAASAATIAGTTFAGMFDEGGKIRNNEVGIVSEYGDELVNGVLVKGPATVTGREDTARIMDGQSQGGSGFTGNVVIQNAPAGYTGSASTNSDGDLLITMQQVAAKYFDDNIDAGVAKVFSQTGSKSQRQMKSTYGTRPKV